MVFQPDVQPAQVSDPMAIGVPRPAPETHEMAQPLGPEAGKQVLGGLGDP